MSATPGDGRRLVGSEFVDDTGEADEVLVAALAAYAADPTTYVEALGALRRARVLVPVVAVLGEVEVDPDDPAGLARDKSSDMAAVLLTGADGRRALLAFTGTSTLAAWDSQARPVPVTSVLAATSAVQEGAAALVVDLAGPVRLVVEGDDLRALAAGWTPGRVDGRAVWIGPTGG